MSNIDINEVKHITTEEISVVKKRGRPRKNQLIPTHNDTYARASNGAKNYVSNREIIVKFPVHIYNCITKEIRNYDSCCDIDSVTNTEMSKEYETYEGSEVDASSSKKIDYVNDYCKSAENFNSENTDHHLEINDDYDDNYTEVNDDSNDKLTELSKEIGKKDMIINNLQKTILKIKNNTTPIGINKIYQMDIKIIDVNNGQTILMKNTNYSCWWCTCKFDTIICVLPDKYQNGVYYVFGCFCSPNCALAFNIDMNDYKVHERTSLLIQFYTEITGISSPIIPSYRKEMLEKYGGPMSEEKYKNKTTLLHIDHILLLPPMVYVVPHIEEKSRNFVSPQIFSNNSD